MCSRAARSRIPLAVALGAVLLAASCGDFSCSESLESLFSAFSLRDSEEPTGSSTQLIPATQALDVRSNILRAINNKDAISYETQLAEDFTFVADPIDVATVEQTYPGAFADWTLAVESAVMEYMLDEVRCDLSILGLSDSTVIEETESLYSIQYAYSFLVILNDEPLQAYSGQARLLMRKEATDNLWRLYRWEDIRAEGSEDDTWGILRGRIRATI
jgi:hypothetical protein